MSSEFTDIETAIKSESIKEKVKFVERAVPRKPVKWFKAKACHPIVQDLLKQKNDASSMDSNNQDKM